MGFTDSVKDTATDAAYVSAGANSILFRYTVQAGDTSPGLDTTSIKTERGFIPVDAHMSTPVPGIFAAGDVTGRYASSKYMPVA